MKSIYRAVVIASLCIGYLIADSIAPTNIGVVVMHGKGGMPSKHVAEFAQRLEAKGYHVANLEMPWSKQREYDVSMEGAQKELELAFHHLRAKGAQKLFLSGHSQGGLVALVLGSSLKVDGIIAIAPGGNVGSPIYKEKISEALSRAQQMVNEGRGDEKAEFYDFESAKGRYAIQTSAQNYLSWFSPDGKMNQEKSSVLIDAKIPVLFIVPTADYPGLLKVKQKMFELLPKNVHTRLYEPNATHLEAPSASIEEVSMWMQSVVEGR